MEQASVNPSAAKVINPKYLWGIKGWLLAFIVTTVMLSVNFLVASFRYIFNPHIELFHSHFEFELIRFSLMIAGVFFPAYVALRLYRIRPSSLLLAKLFLIVFPLASFTWTMFLSIPSPFDIGSAITTSLFGATLLYSLPWFLYLRLSQRVSNTYLSTFSQLPARIQCPFCLSIIQLEENERRQKSAICPDCGSKLSPDILLSKTESVS